MKLYHGSQEENFVPTFGLGHDGHDYGRGFYLTEFPELAKEWAVAADDSRYYRESAAKFIARHGVDVSDYDVIRGWRANASYFYICKSFVRNNIDVAFLGELLRLGSLGIQYFLRTERAFAALVEIETEKESVDAAEWYGRYNRRDRDARSKMYDIIENDPRNDLSRTFKDVL